MAMMIHGLDDTGSSLFAGAVVYIVTHQGVNDLLRRLPRGKRFGGDIFSGKIVHRNRLETLAGAYSPHGGVDLGRRPGQEFIQSVSFFFSHHSHVLLLVLVSQHTERLAATHRMENIRSLFINKIIHDFEQISMDIKAGEQELVVISLKETVKQGLRKSRPNTGFRDAAVFEGGLVEQVVDEHTSYYNPWRINPQTPGKGREGVNV